MNKFLRFFFLFITLNLNHYNTYASSTLDSILNVLNSLTCETQGVGDLLRSEFSHTCIPASFATFAIANLLSPGLYANTLLRLKISDSQLTPNSCNRNNRIEYNDPKITFYMCNNIKLAGARGAAIIQSVIGIAASQLTGGDAWESIKDSWNINKLSYHNEFKDKREGDQGLMIDAGLIPVFPWKVIKQNDKLCVATMSFTGWVPIGCKYIKEPYPESIYSSFIDLNGSTTSSSSAAQLTNCSGSGSCYKRAYQNSKTGIVILAPLIECIREMIARLLVSTTVCSFDQISSVVNSTSSQPSALFQFQMNMRKTVAALLAIYVILYGFKILLRGDIPPKNDIINFVLKLIFVTYFAIGINFMSSTTGRFDGMVQWAIPFLLSGVNSMANWVMSSSVSDLCVFNASDYASNLQHLALWDSLDCRLSHYLGLDILTTMFVENQSRTHDFANFDFFNFSIPPYFYLLIPALYTGNLTLVSLALMYPLLVISVIAHMVTSAITCMIAIVILSMLAPIFVPMMLFSYTKGYFDSWVKLLISFLLQPMVVTSFIVVMFSLYDVGFYGTCKYSSTNITAGDRTTKIFYVNNNWADYATTDEAKQCKRSLGYIINNPFSIVYDLTKTNINQIITSTPNNDESSYKSRFDFLSALLTSKGLFFDSIKLAFEIIRDIILSLITSCLILYLMYNFSEQLSEFAADMTEGVSLNKININPQTLFKGGMKALSVVGNAVDAKNQATNARQSIDKSAGRGDEKNEAQDKISSDVASSEAQDKVSRDGVSSEAQDKASSDGSSSEAQDKASSDGSSSEAQDKASSDGSSSEAQDKASSDGDKSSNASSEVDR